MYQKPTVRSTDILSNTILPGCNFTFVIFIFPGKNTELGSGKWVAQGDTALKWPGKK